MVHIHLLNLPHVTVNILTGSWSVPEDGPEPAVLGASSVLLFLSSGQSAAAEPRLHVLRSADERSVVV